MEKMGWRRCVAAGSVVVMAFVSHDVEAAGFSVHEQSTASQGTAYAGSAAGGEDNSAAYFNPAALALYPGVQISSGFSVVTGDVSFSPQGASTNTGAPVTGGDGGNLIHTGYVPAFTASWQFAPDWVAGLSVNAPYGFTTGSDDPGWIGRYHALGSRVRSVEFDPMLAWKPTDWLAIGGGVRVMYFDARLSNALDIGTIGATSLGVPLPGYNPGDPSQDSYVTVKGSDWAYGYTLGAMLLPRPDTRIGIGFRSKMQVDLSGNAYFDLSPEGQNLSDLSGLIGQRQLVNTGGQASITTPEMVMIGVQHDLSPEWTLAAEADWTRWSRFQDLTVTFDNPDQAPVVTTEGWRNSWFLSLGAIYRPTEKWTLRAGVAYDEGVDPNAELRTPRIPDSDRYWASLGAGYKLTDATTINAAYTHIFAPKTSIRQSTDDPNNADAYRGNLSGTVDAYADIVNVGFTMTF